ncbi:hypothetical protein [Streptomyces hydrogenans]|uniref:hypothetical protein n=1 Tax=Streptomyces hydrogenans TaxID=1873719 RepID=UPI00369B72FA
MAVTAASTSATSWSTWVSAAAKVSMATRASSTAAKLQPDPAAASASSHAASAT